MQAIIPQTKEAINRLLAIGFWEVKFTKTDGTTRTMLATLEPAVIKHVDHKTDKAGKSIKAPRATLGDQINCIDSVLGEWRSFKLSSIISFELKEIC